MILQNEDKSKMLGVNVYGLLSILMLMHTRGSNLMDSMGMYRSMIGSSAFRVSQYAICCNWQHWFSVPILNSNVTLLGSENAK